jgi:hypothetical protein
MRTIRLQTLSLAFVIAIMLMQTCGGAEEKSNLKILNVQFEPIRQGKNIVRVKIQKTTEQTRWA